MHDDPIDGRRDPGEELKDLFDRIEKEEGRPNPAVPQPPSNDEIRAGLTSSPIESHLNDDAFGPEESIVSEIDRPLSPEEERLLKLEREIDEAKARHEAETQDIHDEFTDRARRLNERLGAVKQEHEGRKAKEEVRAKSDASASKGLGVGLSIAYTIIGLPLVGIGIGWLLDQQLHTNVWKGILATIGACAGIAITVMLMNRANENP